MPSVADNQNTSRAIGTSDNNKPSPEDDNDYDKLETQGIPGRNISPAKLTALLRNKFGAEAYSVCMVHNSYTIKAPRKLSPREIEACRRD
ncbi:hypothetical protein F4778DRAFT_14900 [Xylariomycetidae sp. FL2044]|nr:hypothetical protein F4778DRAFT_14900 [Xylariomycetidae sp. FL2044]